ncbi:MAG: SGNH/GDSL hydrolase family protein [Clostridia bacterium]|nr:SGNH/GDSL hydrolase family protein [Clostridia bacterium]
MNESICSLTLDLHRAVAPHVISLKRGDTARELHITLTDNGAPYVITDDCTAELVGYLPIQTAAELPLTAEGNVLSATIPSSWVTTAGEIVCEVRVYSGTSLLLISPSFSLYVGTEFGAAVTIDQTLPLITNADDGKALVANGGVWDKAFVLPEVTDSDSGKVLSVVDGEWDAAEPEKELPAVSSEDNGKVLAVNNGEWGVGQDLSGLPGLVKDVGDIKERDAVTPSLNLFDPDTVEEGVYCKSTDLERKTGSSFNIVKIPVTPGETYVVAAVRPSDAQDNTSCWRYVVFLDSSGAGLSVLDAGVDGYDYGGFTAPTGAAYALISYRNQYTENLIFNAPIPSTWNRFYEYTSPDPSYSLKDTVEIPTALMGVSTANIVDETKMIDGYVSGGKHNSTSGTYKHTPVIPIEPSTTYYSLTPLRFVEHYDARKMFISEEAATSEATLIYSFTTGADDRYVIITGRVADEGTICVSTDPNAQYRPYKKVFKPDFPMLNDAQKNDFLNSVHLDHKLEGKKWVVCGDSFTYGATDTVLPDGPYKGHKAVYPYLIGNRTGINVVLYARNGQTLGYLNDATNPNNNNSLTSPNSQFYYQSIPEDADYITIYLGINDVNYDIPLGTIEDATVETYCGAYNVVLSWLRANRPFAHVGIIVTNGTGSNGNERTLAQIALAKKYGYPYINLNGDERTPAMIRSTNPDIPAAIKQNILNAQAVNPSSNTHPNDAAHAFESTFIENFLKSL